MLGSGNIGNHFRGYAPVGEHRGATPLNEVPGLGSLSRDNRFLSNL
jgi:hypothetical protein